MEGNPKFVPFLGNQSVLFLNTKDRVLALHYFLRGMVGGSMVSVRMVKTWYNQVPIYLYYLLRL